jgi:hypothetical protein
MGHADLLRISAVAAPDDEANAAAAELPRVLADRAPIATLGAAPRRLGR